MSFRGFIFRCFAVACGVVAVACVDEGYDLKDVSKEVTVGQGTTQLFIGKLERKTFKDLLADNKIEGLTADEYGNYTYNYEGKGETISIEGITTNFDVPYTVNEFTVEYPKFDIEMERIVIDENKDLTVDLANLEDFKAAVDVVGGEFTLPENMELPAINGSLYHLFEPDNEVEFEVPEIVKHLRKIIFRNVEDQHIGAPMHFVLDFNDLAEINGGGEVNFNLKVDGGTFVILDKDNNIIYDGNDYVVSLPFAAGAESLEFDVYVESFTNTTPMDGQHLDIPLALHYNLDFQMQTKAGTVSVEKLPNLRYTADFEFGDAEIEISRDQNLVEYAPEEATLYKIKDLPEQVKRIGGVTLADGARVKLFVRGLDWLGEYGQSMEVEVTLPEYLVLNNIPDGGYYYDEAQHKVTTSIGALGNGIEVAVEAIDFGDEGIEINENGELLLELKPYVSAHFVEDSKIYLSSLTHEGELVIEVGLEESRLTIESVRGMVDFTYDVEHRERLTGLDDIDVEINGVGLKPVVEVRFTHPLTVAATLSGRLIPAYDGVDSEENSIALEDIAIPAATFENGAIVPCNATIIIADASLEAQYQGENVIFVACDITELLEGRIPDALCLDLHFGIDSSIMQTIYVQESFDVVYGYGLNLPLRIDDTLDVKYRDSLEDLSTLFDALDELEEYDIRVGNVAVVADICTTLPLTFSADVELKNSRGEATVAQLHIPDDVVVQGSKDSVEEAISHTRFELQLGDDGRVMSLKDVDALSFELQAVGEAANGAYLNENQYVEVVLKLELSGGVTIDIDNILDRE